MSHLVSRCAQLDDRYFGHLVFSTLISREWSLSTEESTSGHTPAIELDERQKLLVLVTPPLASHRTKTCAKLIMLYLSSVLVEGGTAPDGWSITPPEDIKIYFA
jgi:hypothetical protein